MATEQKFFFVPDGSTLEIEVEGPETGFRITADLFSGGQKLRSWTHAQLTAGQQTHPLKKANGAYTLFVDVVFTSTKEAEVVVKVRIRKPSGDVHSEMKKLTFKGKRPQKGHGRVVIRMLRTG